MADCGILFLRINGGSGKMSKKFFIEQNDELKNLYLDLLEVTGSLSNLFSESDIPFLYYRAMENIFCKAFDVVNYPVEMYPLMQGKME